jgi:hypothetical protein
VVLGRARIIFVAWVGGEVVIVVAIAQFAETEI